MHFALEPKAPLTRPLPQGEKFHDQIVANRVHEPRSPRREEGVLPGHLVTSVATTARERFMGRRSHPIPSVRLRYFLSPAAGERTKVRGPSICTDGFMGSLHSVFVAHWDHEPSNARFVVERFSADFRAMRNGITAALKRSTTNDSRSGCRSAIPRFLGKLMDRECCPNLPSPVLRTSSPHPMGRGKGEGIRLILKATCEKNYTPRPR